MKRLLAILPILIMLTACGVRPPVLGPQEPRQLYGERMVLMQGHSLLADEEKHRRTIDLMRDAGVSMIRDEIYWHVVEQEKGNLVVPGHVRRNVKYSVSQGVKILLILDYGNPHYDGDMAPHTPEGREAFARYCKFLAREFRNEIHHFEIWNEPNLDGFWRPQANPADYAELMKVVYPAVKSINPDAFIVAGGLSMIDMDFTREVLEAGAAPYMDAWSVHPYITPRTPTEADMWSDLQAVADLVAEYRDPVPVWITEIGYPTHTDGVTEEYQANVLAQAYIGFLTSPVVPVFGWYWFGPDGPREDLHEDRFGLVRHDWSPKPSYEALKVFTRQMAGAVYIDSPEVSRNVEAHRFRAGRSGEYITALWSNDGIRQVRAEIEGMARAIARDGRETVMQPDDGELFLDLSDEPVYLRTMQKPEIIEMERPGIRLGGRVTVSSNAPAKIGFSSGWVPLDGPKEPEKWLVLRLTSLRWEDRDDFELMGMQLPDEVKNPTYTEYQIRPLPHARRGDHLLALNVAPRGGTIPFARLLQPVTVVPGAHVRLTPLLPEPGEARRFELTILPSDIDAGAEVHARVSIDAPEGVELQPARFDYAGVLGEDGYTREIEIASEHPIDTVFHLHPSVELQSGEVIRERRHVSFMTSPRAHQPITVDGDLSDWPAMPPIMLNRRDQLISEWRHWEGPEDSSARVYTMWDGQRFYVAAEVVDDILSAPVTGFDLYRNDGLEVYFNTNFHGGRDRTRYTANDNQFGFFMEEDHEVIFRWSHLGDYYDRGQIAINRNPTPDQTISGEPCAYIIEGWLPVDDLLLAPEPGMLIGFNTGLSDDDDPRTVHPFGQEVQLMWTGLRNSYMNPQMFGHLFLVDEPFPVEETP